jgi:type I restriction enzyme M protein
VLQFFSGRPFEQGRLSGLLKGLDLSLVASSKLEFSGRIDAEYYRPAFLELEETVKNRGGELLADVADFLIGPFGSAFTVENFTEDSAFRYIRGKDVKPLTLMDDDNVFMPQGDFDRLSRYALQDGDVLISVVGTLGNAALVTPKDLPAIFSCKSTAIRNATINPVYLTVYLNCRFGRELMLRKERGAIQKGLNLDDLRDVPVFVPSPAFQAAIEQRFRRALEMTAELKRLMQKAGDVLLAALGLTNWTPPEPLAYTACASDVFASGRFDAQYFRPLFAEVADRLQATGGAVELGTILSVNARGKQPQYDETGLPVINSKHVRTNRVILEDNRTATESGSPVDIQTGDVLLNGTGVGTIGRAAPYLHSTRALPDNHVTVLRTGSVDPVYLSVFLNSPLGQRQIERHIKGSSGQIELYPADIARITIWDAPDTVQQSVRAAILSAFDEERRANDLLEAAKRAVEIAIEDGESAATAYLDQAGGAI